MTKVLLDFDLEIYSSCRDTLFTYMNSISTTFYYQINSIVMDLFTLSFTQSLTYCPVITYQIITSVATNFLTIPGSNVVQIYTSNIAYIGTHHVEIKGEVRESSPVISYLSDSIFVDIVIVGCSSLVFSPVQIEDQVYNLG